MSFKAVYTFLLLLLSAGCSKTEVSSYNGMWSVSFSSEGYTDPQCTVYSYGLVPVTVTGGTFSGSLTISYTTPGSGCNQYPPEINYFGGTISSSGALNGWISEVNSASSGFSFAGHASTAKFITGMSAASVGGPTITTAWVKLGN